MSHKDDNKDSVLAGMLFGLITGALFTLLYTPKSGKEVREELKTRANDLPSEVNNLLGDIKELYHKASDVFASLSKEQYTKLKTALEETKKNVKSKIHDISSSDEENNG